MQVAAIWYAIDQNEPSMPFLLDLKVSGPPTKEELEQALIAEACSYYAEMESNLDPEDRREVDFKVSNNPYLGLCVGDDPYLFVGLPEQYQSLREQFPTVVPGNDS